ncbi:MAG: DUF58 domain-containing protein [Bacteroidetes bacterium]|nr:DUF58 domain-containing protein [Bacteroidota bacterium]
MIKTILYNTFLTNRFFIAVGMGVALCALGYFVPFLFGLAWIILAILLIASLFDAVFLWRTQGKIDVVRDIPPVLPLGDETEVILAIESKFPYPLESKIIDELPYEFQERKFQMECRLDKLEGKRLKYPMRPVNRGVFQFGNCNVFLTSALGFVQFRHVFEITQEVKVYPSVLQMKQHELAVIKNVAQFQGMKKIRRLGHSYEFEQIKNYVLGDDIRSVNWKATSRKGELMVNQYGDERSQQLYCIIDKSRVMQLPFNGLSLMDYAVNTSLVISNIALQKHDKAGLVSFDHRIGSMLKADNRSNQLKKIIELLYREKPSDLEANYQLLYAGCQRIIKQRSLIVLYTNFESSYALDRVIPILRRLNQLHLLLVIFFENSELEDYSWQSSEDIFDIYTTTMAAKFQLDKKMMLKRLNQYGIQTLLTKPEDLSVNTVNKYLEFKARGWI